MRMYLFVFGSLCILYYVILAIYSRRLRSTFAAFWLFSGGTHLLLGCVPLPVYIEEVLGCIFLGLWIIFLIVELRICVGMFSNSEPRAQWIIVLGAQVRGTKVTDSLRMRLDAAISYLQENEDTMVIVSGGQGLGEDISEADAMAQYLVKNGIAKERIRKEERSSSTRENLHFSRQFFDAEEEKVGIVTNNFHSYRAKCLAKQEGYGRVFSLSAPSNSVYQMNYLVREFFAVLAMTLKKRKDRDCKQYRK